MGQDEGREEREETDRYRQMHTLIILVESLDLAVPESTLDFEINQANKFRPFVYANLNWIFCHLKLKESHSPQECLYIYIFKSMLVIQEFTYL